jgi:predicted membrane protein
MYAALWRVLPGPWWVRVLILVVALAVILYALVFWVFPWVQGFVAPQDVTVSKK